MIIYKDLITGDELLSEGYKFNLVDDVVYEVDCEIVEHVDGVIDTGANPSGEGDDVEVTNDFSKFENNYITTFRLTETLFDLKTYKTFMKAYMKTIKEHLVEKSPDQVETFMKGVTSYSKKIFSDFHNWKFYYGESMNPDGMVVLLNYREDQTTPYVVIWKHGLTEYKI